MAEYETEEQQIEALKKWFNENAMSLFLGLGIGVASLLGWRYYVDYQNEHGIQASDIYTSVIKQISVNKLDDSIKINVEKLINEYSDTPYAALISLAMAKYEFENKNVEDAVSRLKWVSKQATDTEIQHVAQLRLAKILLEQKKYDEAEQLLSAEHPSGFISRYEELKGDLYVAMGAIAQARVAYDKAIVELGKNEDHWLKLKRRDLGNDENKKPAEPPA